MEAAGAALSLPGQWDWNRTQYAAENQPPASPGKMRLTFMEAVTPEIFRALRISLVAGRALSAQDGPDSTPGGGVEYQLRPAALAG